jgi:hypothetical protein
VELILFLKSIGESLITMILWFLNIRHSAQQMFRLILPSKV